MRVHLVDPSAYTPAYDRALCEALARGGARVELITSRFPYGQIAAPAGYTVHELFYRHALGAAGSRLRQVTKLAEHPPDMLRYRRRARSADVVHFQWLPVQWLDRHLLPDRPLVLTAHDLLPREPRLTQVRGQRRLYQAVDAIVVHSRYGWRQLVDTLEIDPGKVHLIHHGAFEHLAHQPTECPLPVQLRGVDQPVVLFFGLMRPYKGLEVLLEAWQGIEGAELWIVGRPRMAVEPLRTTAPAGVRFVPRFVADAELPAYFRRADVVVLPYSRTDRFDQSGVLAAALAFGKAIVVSDVGGLGEVAASGAARLVAPNDPVALREAIAELLGDRGARERLQAAARSAAEGPFSWGQAATKTIALYAALSR